MNIIYISPIGQYNHHLYPTYEKTFEANGHTQTYYPREATHCFIEIVSGVCEYNQDLMRVIKEVKIPIIAFDNREFHVNGVDWKPIDLPIDIYFVRTMVKDFPYPKNVYPYDWAYFHDYHRADKESLFSRPYDVCYIGCESPTRRKVIDALIRDGRLKVKHIFNDHLTRLPHLQWVSEYKEAKMALECEAGGLTTEKFLQLFSIAPQLIVTNEMIRAFPFEDAINCLEISKQPTGEEIEKVVDILADKDWLWDIYNGGIEHIHKYHSNEAVSNYVLQTLNNCGI